jgi:hypothetical protein
MRFDLGFLLLYYRFTLPITFAPSEFSHQIELAQRVLAVRQVREQSKLGWILSGDFIRINYYDVVEFGDQFMLDPHGRNGFMARDIPVIARGRLTPDQITVRVMISPPYSFLIGGSFGGGFLFLAYQGLLPLLGSLWGVLAIGWYLGLLFTFQGAARHLRQIFTVLAEGPEAELSLRDHRTRRLGPRPK